MNFWRARDEELHRHPIFLVQERRYLSLVFGKAHDLGDHALPLYVIAV